MKETGKRPEHKYEWPEKLSLVLGGFNLFMLVAFPLAALTLLHRRIYFPPAIIYFWVWCIKVSPIPVISGMISGLISLLKYPKRKSNYPAIIGIISSPAAWLAGFIIICLITAK
jgi:hypothetical protein